MKKTKINVLNKINNNNNIKIIYKKIIKSMKT